MEDIIERYKHYLLEGDDLTVIVLKGHLMIEEELGSIVAGFLPNAEAVAKARLTFFHKTALAQSICWKRPSDDIWSLIFAINSLRNDLAHSLESEKRDSRFDDVLEQHLAMSVRDPDYRDIQESSREQQLVLAIVHILGFLRNFRHDVNDTCRFWHQALNKRQKLIDENT